MENIAPQGKVDRRPVDLVGVNNIKLPTAGGIVLWTKIGEKEFPIKFVIIKELKMAVMSFRALVLFGLAPINFGVELKENGFL